MNVSSQLTRFKAITKLQMILLFTIFLIIIININKCSVNCSSINSTKNKCDLTSYPMTGCPQETHQRCNNKTNICECNPLSDYRISHKKFDNKEYCLQKRNYTQTCIVSDQCFDTNINYKSNKSHLICVFDHQFNGNSVIINKDFYRLGSKLRSDSERHGICDCREDYVYSETSGQCLEKYPKIVCNNDSDCEAIDKQLICGKNVFIWQNFCQCINGSLLKTSQSFKTCLIEDVLVREEVVTEYIGNDNRYWFEKKTSITIMFFVFSVLFLIAIVAEMVLKFISRTYSHFISPTILNANNANNTNNGINSGLYVDSVSIPIYQNRCEDNEVTNQLNDSLMTDSSCDDLPPNYDEVMAAKDNSLTTESQI